MDIMKGYEIMNFNGIEVFDILKDQSMDVPDIIPRLERERETGNALLFIAGKGQSGKTNNGVSIGNAFKQRGVKVTYTFSIYDFFEIATDPKRRGEVIIYDEPQQDIPNWWNELYTIMKEIIESYGYLHHILIVISPSQKNIWRLFSIFHFFCKMTKEWSNNKPIYWANYYSLDTKLNGDTIFLGLQTKRIERVDAGEWAEFIRLKELNYSKRAPEWKRRIEAYKQKLNRMKRDQDLREKLKLSDNEKLTYNRDNEGSIHTKIESEFQPF